MSPLLDDFQTSSAKNIHSARWRRYLLFAALVSLVFWICVGLNDYTLLSSTPMTENLARLWVFTTLFSGMWLYMRVLTWRWFGAFFMSMFILILAAIAVVFILSALQLGEINLSDDQSFMRFFILNTLVVAAYLGTTELLHYIKELRTLSKNS